MIKKITCLAEEWFIDGTFWIVPPKFYQMLNILVFSKELNKSNCVTNILMSSKKTEDCMYTFINLLVTIKLAELPCTLNFIMYDFESGLRKALALTFPQTKLLGSEFHCVKAPWINP
jgi:MULE transposase domain